MTHYHYLRDLPPESMTAGQDFWHSDNSYVGCTVPAQSCSVAVSRRAQRRDESRRSEAQECSGPTLLYALKVPQGPEVQRDVRIP